MICLHDGYPHYSRPFAASTSRCLITEIDRSGGTMIEKVLEVARAAFDAAPPAGDPAYPLFATTVARMLERGWDEVLEANDADSGAARAAGLPPAMVDRMGLADRHRDALVDLTRRV